LKQASEEFKRTKIQTKSNETQKYRGIKFEDAQYYGVKKVKGKILNIPLDENFIKSVKLENETLSTIFTIAIPVVIIGAGLAIIAASLNDLGNLGGNWNFGY
jgi:prolipoprotein diacylglyceryltransferase